MAEPMHKAPRVRFDEFVERTSRGAGTEFDADEVLADWKVALAAFSDRVRSYLKPYVERGDVSLAPYTKRLHEDRLGEYEVDGLHVDIGRTRVTVAPVGTHVVGARGRIDLRGPGGTSLFVLVPESASRPGIEVSVRTGDDLSPEEEESSVADGWTWKKVDTVDGYAYVPLDEDVFLEALMEAAGA